MATTPHLRLLTTASELAMYDAWLRAHHCGSLWQSLEWKAYQEALGREVRIYVVEGEVARPAAVGRGSRNEEVGMGKWGTARILASALVVIDRTALGFSTWDIPRGPLVEEAGIARGCCDSLLKKILNDAKRERCLSVFFSPASNLQAPNFELRASCRHEQPEATRVIDLTQTDEQILAQMKPKGRYNIGIAQRHNVMTGESHELHSFTELLKETASRDGFTPLPQRHYAVFLEKLPGSFLLIAEAQKKPIAGLLGALWGEVGIYYYGSSSYADRTLMAPYLLQWEAMRLCKARGCTSYDLLGIAPLLTGSPTGAALHPWSGITRFKEQFGGTLTRYPPEQEIVLRPGLRKLIEWKRDWIG